MTPSPWTLPVLALFFAVSAPGQPPPNDPTVQAAMEREQAATRVGKHHEALRYFLGRWDVEMRLVMPTGAAAPTSGTATYEWLIDGRWLSLRIVGTLLGQPYEAVSILGFDTYAQSHVVVTVSSLDTAMNLARGPVVDPEGKVTSVYGTLDEYTTGELRKPFRVTTRIVDDDHHTIEVWDLGIGERGAQVLEFNFTRNNSKAKP